MKKLFLVDAYALIFKYYYAFMGRPMRNRSGMNTSIIFGFTKFLRDIQKREKPDLLGVAFDPKGGSFRKDIFPEYKANRPPMPEDLKKQMPRIEEMAAAFGWPLLRAENYEADDLIGAFAGKLAGSVLILTGDKDLSSLVTEKIHLLKPARSGGGFLECGPEEVVSDFGVEPALIPDYLALLGDSVDNIDGVPGVGTKSAVELLKKYGPAEKWYDEEGNLLFTDSKFSAKLRGKKELVMRNLLLTRLKTELPAEFADVGNVLDKKSPDWQKIADMCADNQFKSLLKELPVEPSRKPQADELF